MPPNLTRRLSQLTSPKPHPGGRLLELLVHMAAESRKRRKDSLRKRHVYSALICHLPRGGSANEPDLAAHVEVGVYMRRARRPIGGGGCERVCFVPACPSHPRGLTLRIWLAVSGVRKAFPCKFQSGGVKCNWLPFSFRIDTRLRVGPRTIRARNDPRACFVTNARAYYYKSSLFRRWTGIV